MPKIGCQYSVKKMIQLRFDISCHLQLPPFNRNFSLVHDLNFSSSSKLFNVMIRELTEKKNEELGLGPIPISPADLKKLHSSRVLSNDNAQSLQQKVFFNLLLHFPLSARKTLTKLRKDSFQILMNLNGVEYISPSQELMTIMKSAKPRYDIYSSDDKDNCVVSSYKLYFSKLDPRVDELFTRCKAVNDVVYQSNVWYTNIPLDNKTLTAFMKEISAKADLSTMYMNSCIFATSNVAVTQPWLSHNRMVRDRGNQTIHQWQSLIIQEYVGTGKTQKKSAKRRRKKRNLR